MKRLSYLIPIAALLAVMAAVVVYMSPYAPVVQPVREIEEIWEIEDARLESESPLVTALEYNGVPLAYDWAENTFYCALGLEDLDEWPPIHLTAPQAPGVTMCFVDDYSYDWCADAVREGYAYELIAYTDMLYSYARVVFTGLPIVSIHAQGDLLPHEDVPVSVSLSWDKDTAMTANARAHKRGDTTLRTKQKNGIKVEYTRKSDGRKKTSLDMPFLGLTDEFILIAGAMDPLLIRDRLSWDLYNGIVEESEPFGRRETAYVEVFVNDRYQGVYLMMKPYNYTQEMNMRAAGAAQTDSLYRLAGGSVHEFDRPVMQDHRLYYYEEHHAPAGAEPFASLEAYLKMFAETDNAKFCEQAMELLDIDSVIRYALYVQACGMMDNEHNNLYIWTQQTGAKTTCVFAPWDLDISWGLNDEENSEVWYAFPLFDRLVELDCGGIVRRRVKEIWQQMRADAFNEENLDALIQYYNRILGDSGAFYRDAVRWNRSNSYPDGYSTFAYGAARFVMMDKRIEAITDPALKDRHIRVSGYSVFDEGPLEEAMRGESAD